MKKIIFMSAVAMLAPHLAQAQGTTYLSSLSATSRGSLPVGNDYWQAADFHTGNFGIGYLLDSVQLALTPATDNPNAFMVMLYSATNYTGNFPVSIMPGTLLGVLSGSADPTTNGIYTFMASGLTLDLGTDYFIVLTAGTAVANGAYNWSLSDRVSSIVGWTDIGGVSFHSSNGISDWSPVVSGTPQFAINATAVPEPGILSLLVVGGLLFSSRRVIY